MTLRVSSAEFERLSKTTGSAGPDYRLHLRRQKVGSEPEERFALQCRAEGLTPEREYRFCERRWRLDFAWPEQKVCVEVDGGVWSGGRHIRGSGFVKDIEKQNRLNADGWTVLRFTPAQVNDGSAIKLVKEVLGR